MKSFIKFFSLILILAVTTAMGADRAPLVSLCVTHPGGERTSVQIAPGMRLSFDSSEIGLVSDFGEIKFAADDVVRWEYSVEPGQSDLWEKPDNEGGEEPENPEETPDPEDEPVAEDVPETGEDEGNMTTGVREAEVFSGMQVSFNGRTLDITGLQGEGTVTLATVGGEICYSSRHEGNISIDLGQFAKGIYIVTVEGRSFKIIKR